MRYSHVRARRVVDAVGKRISKQGDMPIRVSRGTMRMLMTALGVGQWEPGCDDFREVDALALDVLRHLALQRLPA